MADVTLIRSKNRAYLRSNSDRGTQFMLEEFNGVHLSVEGVNYSFSIEHAKEIEEYCQKNGIEVENK